MCQRIINDGFERERIVSLTAAEIYYLKHLVELVLGLDFLDHDPFVEHVHEQIAEGLEMRREDIDHHRLGRASTRQAENQNKPEEKLTTIEDFSALCFLYVFVAMKTPTNTCAQPRGAIM
jgi:hypothetical protein